jgi:hypothetical protein
VDQLRGEGIVGNAQVTNADDFRFMAETSRSRGKIEDSAQRPAIILLEGWKNV